ncbi:MAG: hypothetical protein WBG50_20935 [Desulfomonilaceae bacterium]
METGTGLSILGTALGSAKLLEKLLGPTADYLGGEIRSYAEKGVHNLGRIFKHAEKTLGGKIDEPGQVPPKVLKEVLQEGYFCEDELSAQYFGGVLASSRSGVFRDDRGASFVGLIGRLSVYQIRTHFIFYSIFRNLCSGRSGNLGLSYELDKFQLFMPFSVYLSAMDFQDGENPEVLISHAMYGLVLEKLISDAFATGSADTVLKEMVPGAEFQSDGIVFSPSPVGMELYLWAHGLGSISPAEFLTCDLVPMRSEAITIPEGSRCFP